MPRFAIIQPATGLSIPPETSRAADIYYNIRVMNIDLQMMEPREYLSADFSAYLGRIERKLLVRALRLNLKGRSRIEQGSRVFNAGVENNIHILFDCGCAGESGYAENLQ